MTILGFTSQHYFGDARTIEQLRLADYDLDVLRRLEFACDLPIPLIYRQLEDVYPGSKYILTERDIDSWLASQIRATRKRSTPNLGSPRSFLRALAYGCDVYHEGRYRCIYRDHLAQVDDFFSGARKLQLLRINVTKGKGWTTLCRFLDRPEPSVPFPHANKGVALEESRF